MKRSRARMSPRYPLLEGYRSALARCVRCGACRAVCPSFLAGREESRSARGRMALIAAVLEGRLAVSDVYRERLATCFGCLACETACASGVPVSAVIQAAREEALREAGRGLIESVLAAGLQHPSVLRTLAWLGPRIVPGLRELPKTAGRAPRRPFPDAVPEIVSAAPKTGRVALFAGCAATYAEQDLAAATVAVLERLGFAVLVPRGQVCCGKPLLSLGDREAAAALARRNAEVFAALDMDAVVTACASCGSALKHDYRHLLGEEAGMPRVLDIHEILAERVRDLPMAPVALRVTWHDPCHLRRGQGLSGTVREVLRSIPGLELAEMKDPGRCCGFGGLMRITHGELSLSIGDAKARDIISTGASAVATGCPGCRIQIAEALRRAGSPLPVVHTVQLIEQATREKAACGVQGAEYGTGRTGTRGTSAGPGSGRFQNLNLGIVSYKSNSSQNGKKIFTTKSPRH